MMKRFTVDGKCGKMHHHDQFRHVVALGVGGPEFLRLCHLHCQNPKCIEEVKGHNSARSSNNVDGDVDKDIHNILRIEGARR